MSQKAPWLILAGLVLLLATLGYVLLGTGAGSAPAPEVGQASEQEQPAAPGTPLVGSVPETEGMPATTPGRERVEDLPTAGEGKVVVTGRLVTADGAPLSRHEVAMSLLRRVARDFAIPGLDNSPGEETTSDADGRFHYFVDAGQGGIVRLAGSEYVLLEGTARFDGSNADIDLGDLQAIRASVLAGQVLDSAGSPVPGVQVQASAGADMLSNLRVALDQSLTNTDDEGRFRLPGLRPGDYRLRTASPAFLPADRAVSVAVGEIRDDIVLELERGNAIAGVVVDDLGRPLAGINVAAQRRTTPSAGLTVQRFAAGEATETDDNGRFTLAGLDGDAATVRAWGEGVDDIMQSDVAMGTGNLVLQANRLAAIEGVLVDELGGPISGSTVRASQARGGNSIDTMVRQGRVRAAGTVTTEADGSFRIEGVRPGTMMVAANGDSHLPARSGGMDVRPGETITDVRLVATRGATVRVEVVDSNGDPVPRTQVVVQEPVPQARSFGGGGQFTARRSVRVEDRDGEQRIVDSSEPQILGRATTDEQGIAVVPGLPAGAAEVKATHIELVPGQPEAVTVPAAGTVQTRLTMVPGGFVEVATLDAQSAPLANARYRVSGMGSEGAQPGRTDGRGVARVGPLSPGMYSAELLLEPAGQRMGAMMLSFGESRSLPGSQREFRINPGETAEVQLIKPVLTTFRGTVFDAEGPVSGATVQVRPQQEGGRRGRMPFLGGGSSATTGADGSFEIAELTSGSYTVEYGRRDQLVNAEQEVEFLPGQAESRQDLRLSGGTLTVTVLSSTGAPVVGARIEVAQPTQGQPRRMEFVAISANVGGGGETTRMEMGAPYAETDAQGVAVIPDVPPGSYALQIGHGDYADHTTETLEVNDGATTVAEVVRLVQGGDLRGNVRGARGGQVAIAMVEYQLIGSESSDRQPAMDGSFSLDGLAPGKYRLRARSIPMGGGSTSDWGPYSEVEVVSGSTASVELQLPDGQ